MIDYFFVGICFFFVGGITFFFLTFTSLGEQDIVERMRSVVFAVLSMIFNTGEGLFITAADETWGQIFMWPFYFLAMLSFVYLIFLAVSVLDSRRSARWQV